ncbi:Chitin synthase, class 3 [Ascosphaera atra]|nr:Chitin synthase, class 3 [Ascosphaera atra]
MKPPSLWNVYCGMVTFWAPDAALKCFGMPAKAQRRAWREKIGLISIILLIAGFVGFLTFGFTAVVCGQPTARLKINHVDKSYLIAHGKAYNMTLSRHPAAYGIPAGSNVLYDLPHKYGGEDVSFMFQNVNGACKGLIKARSDAGIPTSDNGDVAWYFPCVPVAQDGSSKPNWTEPPYPGYACHTSSRARHTFYHDLRVSGDVYFTWDDIKNASRNLIVWSNNVLDLDLLAWLNGSAVTYPRFFDELRQNDELRGVDVSYMFQAGRDKKIARCLSQIIRVGSVDTETIGCIASKVVLYVSLVFILSVVLAKFVLACFFQWFLSRQFAASKTRIDPDSPERQREIEDWTDDIYRPAPAAVIPSVYDRDRKRRPSRLFPTTSRFTSPDVASRQDGLSMGNAPAFSTSRRAPRTMSRSQQLPGLSGLWRR